MKMYKPSNSSVSFAIAGDAISKRAGGRSFAIGKGGKCEEMEVTGYMVCLGYVKWVYQP